MEFRFNVQFRLAFPRHFTLATDGGQGKMVAGPAMSAVVEGFDFDAAGAAHLNALQDGEAVSGGGSPECSQVAGEGRGGRARGRVFHHSAPGEGVARAPLVRSIGGDELDVTQFCARQRVRSPLKS